MPTPDPSDDLKLTAEHRIDAACQRFEAEWKAGRPPRIEEYLADFAGPERAALERELSLLDANYRATTADLGAADAAGDPEDPTRTRVVGAAGEPEDPTRTRVVGTPAVDATVTFGGEPGRPAGAGAPPDGELIAGRYKPLQLIGEGGMGAVYLAEQVAPVKRRVALKLIKAGMDSKSVLARFDAERQALALMDHPNIARIYDGGVTAAGQPFCVMELVAGVPLTDYCDRHRLTVDARLQLFIAVCLAVQHAHQKGIIHRDLKPGNVLVTEVDGRPTPKVIDFGVAKATEQKLTDLSFTDAGAIVGTPAYMSPEQADPTTMDVDTRSDVYALGVMLYELLVGSPPIDAKQFKRGAILEMLRMVREVEPPRPSTKLSTGDALPNIAANRGLEPAKLARLLQGELDWVVMKAIEKDRARRYDTANALAHDLQRYLANEVVQARPPSRAYRLRKFVRRNRAAVTAGALVAAAVLAGGIGVVVQWREAVYQRSQAEQARGTAEENYRAAMNQRMTALKALGRMVDVARKELPKAPGTQDAQQKVLTIVGDSLQSVARNPLTDIELNDNTLAAVYEASARLHATLGELQPAVEELRKAEALLEQSLKNAAGKPDEFQTATRQNLAVIELTLGNFVQRLGSPAAAIPHFNRARDLIGDLGPDAPADYRANLALLYRMAGAVTSATDPRAGRKLYEDSLRVSEELARDHPSEARSQALVDSLTLVAGADFHLSDPVASERRHREAVRIAEGELAKADTPVWKNRAGHAHDRLGDLLLRTGKPAAALVEYKAALALFAPLAAADLKNVNAAGDHARVLYSLGLASLRANDAAAAAGHFRASLAIREARAKAKPEWSAFADLMVSLARAGRLKEAADMADRVLKETGNAPERLVDTACCFAICSAAPTTDAAGQAAAKGYAARAIQDLKKAIDLGYKDRVNLETEPDLDGIRNDPEFKKLLEKIPEL